MVAVTQSLYQSHYWKSRSRPSASRDTLGKHGITTYFSARLLIAVFFMLFIATTVGNEAGHPFRFRA